MKFAVLTKAKVAEIHERPLPEIGDHQVLIKQEACNICTTDYGQWQGLREHQPYPMAGGHEGAGGIVKKGAKVRDDLEIGDKVAIAYNYCGECDPCKSGATSECTQVKHEPSEDGYYGNFGFADYCVRDSRVLIKMNKNLSSSEASFLEPLATVIKGFRKLRLKPLETVVIIGAGTMGVVNAQAARAYGCRVIITEVMEDKVKAARDMGFEVVNANENDPVEKVKELTNGVGADMQDFITSAKLLNEKRVDMSKLVETTFPLDKIQEAYKVASDPASYRVSVLL